MIRAAAPADAPALLAIYAPYVKKTAITFEYDVPTEEEFRGRISRTLQRYPYLAAEQNGEILGYAYTGPFGERAAYNWAAETSCMLNWSGFPLHRIFKIFTPALLSQKQQTPISLTTASNFTPIWGILSPENSITAAINSAPGIIWFGWKKYSVCTLCRPHRSCRSRS